MKFRGLLVLLLFALVTACGGGSGSNDNEAIVQEDGAIENNDGIEPEPEPEPEPQPELEPITGDFNGNGIADAFESGDHDIDGDFISDYYDSELVPGDDVNSNGINDLFEGALNGAVDNNQDGMNDLFTPAVQRSDAPPPVALGAIEGEIVFTADYESGTENSGNPGIEAYSPPAEDAISISDLVARSGDYAINHRVRFRDDYISADRYRSETNTIGVPESRYNDGDKFKYQFSIYLEPPWLIDTHDSMI